MAARAALSVPLWRSRTAMAGHRLAPPCPPLPKPWPLPQLVQDIPPRRLPRRPLRQSWLSLRLRVITRLATQAASCPLRSLSRRRVPGTPYLTRATHSAMAAWAAHSEHRRQSPAATAWHRLLIPCPPRRKRSPSAPPVLAIAQPLLPRQELS